MIRQILGMTWYEAKMHWRRRPLLVMMLVILFFFLSGVVIIGSALDDFAELKTNPDGLADLLIYYTWAPLGILLALVYPILIADAVPIDRHVKMADMLATYPLSPGVYVAGKLGGVWLATCLPILGMGIFSTLAWRLVAGNYHMLSYFNLWLVGAIPMVILNGGLGMMIGAIQPTRRRAMLMVIGVFVLSFMIGFYTQTWWDYVNPMRAILFQYFLMEYLNPELAVTSGQVGLMMLGGFLEILIAGGFISYWLPRHTV